MAGIGKAHLRDTSDVLLRVEDLEVQYPAGRGQKVHAVSQVSLDLRRGETLGLVGESGCGKSTLGRAMVQLPAPTSGSVSFDGVELTALKGEALRRQRPRMQMIFQDPISSLNDRRTVRDLVAEGLRVWNVDKGSVDGRVDEVLEAVGLSPAMVGDRRPRSFSGGQCQRICIARALVLEPELVVCDEPVSALDVSVQAQILNLLEDMKARYGLTLLFITHDLGVVKSISDRIVVMYLGRICEVARTDALFEAPAHPYTRLLLSSVPRIEPGRDEPVEVVAPTEMPSPLSPHSGCRFRTRCPAATEICVTEVPEMAPVGDDHFVACHHPHLDSLVTIGSSGAGGAMSTADV